MTSSKCLLIFSGLAVSISLLGQAQTTNVFTSPPGSAAYVNAGPVNSMQIDPSTPLSGFILSMPPDGSASSAIFKNPTLGRTGNPNAHSSPHFSNNGGNIPGLTTASTFGGAFAAQAGPSKGQVMKYTMLGNDPVQGNAAKVRSIRRLISRSSGDSTSNEIGVDATMGRYISAIATASPCAASRMVILNDIQALERTLNMCNHSRETRVVSSFPRKRAAAAHRVPHRRVWRGLRPTAGLKPLVLY